MQHKIVMLSHWSLGGVPVILKISYSKLNSRNSSMGIRCEIILKWIPQNATFNGLMASLPEPKLT